MNGSPTDGSDPTEDAVGPGSGHRMPGWVKGFVIAVAVVLVVVMIALLLGGDHGPGRHLPGGAAGLETTAGDPPPVHHG